MFPIGVGADTAWLEREKADQHRSDGSTSTTATLHTDYGFLGTKMSDRFDKDSLPFVVVKDGPPPQGTRWLDSHAMQS